MFFIEILIDYIIPIIYSSFTSLVLVLIILFIFRIRDSNIRILFFFLPLIKPFLTVSEKFSKIYSQSNPITGGFRFPDPNNILRILEKIEKGPTIFSDINYLTLLLIIISIVIILITKWITLYFFYRNLAREDIAGRKDIPEIYDIIDDYTKKTKTKAPYVSLTHRHYFSPFVIGLF